MSAAQRAHRRCRQIAGNGAPGVDPDQRRLTYFPTVCRSVEQPAEEAMSGKAAKIAASAAEIRAIVGDIDDATVVSIRDTGATAAEVLEALQWTDADEELGSELGHARGGPAGRVYEILQSLEPEEP
jgi:hypothetical protein